jgi:hypothetical protein
VKEEYDDDDESGMVNITWCHSLTKLFIQAPLHMRYNFMLWVLCRLSQIAI